MNNLKEDIKLPLYKLYDEYISTIAEKYKIDISELYDLSDCMYQILTN